MRGLTAVCCVALVLHSVESVKPKYQGRDGMPVSGCKCKGGGSDGDCGFHLSAGKEDEPWCRTEYGCGYPATLFKGSWAYCNKGAVERRRADDGKFYNSYEFSKYYREEGLEMWKKAKPFQERRYDIDNNLYSITEFRSYYVDMEGENGWLKKWEALAEYPEKRTADGKERAFDEMWTAYGKSEVWKKWEAAAPKKVQKEL
eukprot:TRINITY_DN85709_c0_g1_i1.p2 TRINITY_DN85709_c0_g1~~TRINITY_DN85709_c0_g1_i1.p2  ORF type:complete len:201 (-),score=47.14 TRINITY_DN85709_c0_g1_i1:110-712(-)